MDLAEWNADEVAAYLAHGIDKIDTQAVAGTGEHGMVVGSTGPFAQLAGRRALQAGGSATDAVLATALAQVALAAGSWVSYAGVFTMVHYEAATGEVSSLSAGFATFAEERDPASIPAAPDPSGRSALVPGFMAGVHTAHQQFGRLSWPQLFEPAIYVAEHGFPVGIIRERQFDVRADVLARTPEARRIFFDDDGTPLLRRGATFRQPDLAVALRHLAADGVDWMYRGPWARRFVELVGAHGGHPTVDDLANYEPTWATPYVADFAGHQVHTAGPPDYGGNCLVAGLHLLAEADLGDPTLDDEALYWLIQIARQTTWPNANTERVTDPHYARQVWAMMRDAGRFVARSVVDAGSHSDFVLAADQHGNLAAACHSINTSLWGTTGLFVDGISIPDAACYQQPLLALLGPGAHVPLPVNPAIATRDGIAVLASSSIGGGLQVATLQGLHATLALGIPVTEAVGRPFFHGTHYLSGDSVAAPVDDNEPAASERVRQHINNHRTRISDLAAQVREAGVPPQDMMATVLRELPQTIDDRFHPALLQAVQDRGQPLSIRPLVHLDLTMTRGFWGALSVNPESPRLRGGHTPLAGGGVEHT
jgi:gamma-glutamyltranspeptidase / glutathione hydrolase